MALSLQPSPSPPPPPPISLSQHLNPFSSQIPDDPPPPPPVTVVQKSLLAANGSMEDSRLPRPPAVQPLPSSTGPSSGITRFPSSGLRPPLPTPSGLAGRLSGKAFGGGAFHGPPASPSVTPSASPADPNGFRDIGLNGSAFPISRERDRFLTDQASFSSSRLSHTPSALPQIMHRGSDREMRLSTFPSDIGMDFERVTSEKLGNADSFGPAQPLSGFSLQHRTDSTASGAPVQSLLNNESSANGNLFPGFRLTFQSLISYGNTEKSSNSLYDERNLSSGGPHHHGFGSRAEFPGINSIGSLRPSFHTICSSPGRPHSSKVAEAAGMLYRSKCFDENWVLGNPIGAGAFSEVRLGMSKDGSRTVAVKIVGKGAPDLFTVDGECREVVAFKIAGKHSNIVACHEVYEDDRFIYLILELLTGGPILQRVANKEFYGSYCENDVITLVRGLTKGLAHLHELGIAHRDVKPENVLFASDSMGPSVKLTDFGIAQSHCLTNTARDMVGTPLYVAPEVLLRKPYGCQSDMWSLGVVVHILLTGYPPFDHDDLVQLVNMVKYEPFRMDGDEWTVVSEAGRDFVRRLLTREVGKRLTASQALSHAWLSSPRPPPFPAPEAHALDKEASPAVPQAGTIPLVVAQSNLYSFVIRKEWKQFVHRKSSEQDLKLSMLVSLSEKSLKISESCNALEDNIARKGGTRHDDESKGRSSSQEVQEAHLASTALVSSNRKQSMEDDKSVVVSERNLKKEKERAKRREKKETKKRMTESSGRSSVSAGGGGRGRASSGATTDAEPKKGKRENQGSQNHDREQERLRQKRLQLQAELSKRRKTGTSTKSSSADGRAGRGGGANSVARKRWYRTNEASERTDSGSIGSLSPGSSCQSSVLNEAVDAGEMDGLPGESGATDQEGDEVACKLPGDDEDWEVLPLIQRERRDANAQEDVEQVFKQRIVGKLGQMTGRRSSASTKDQAVSASSHDGNSKHSKDRDHSPSKSRKSAPKKEKDKRRRSKAVRVLRRYRDDNRDDESSV